MRLVKQLPLAVPQTAVFCPLFFFTGFQTKLKKGLLFWKVCNLHSSFNSSPVLYVFFLLLSQSSFCHFIPFHRIDKAAFCFLKIVGALDNCFVNKNHLQFLTITTFLQCQHAKSSNKRDMMWLSCPLIMRTALDHCLICNVNMQKEKKDSWMWPWVICFVLSYLQGQLLTIATFLQDQHMVRSILQHYPTCLYSLSALFQLSGSE